MPKASDFTAVIFDVDDTLLDNHPKGRPGGLHEESRLRAIHHAGKNHHIPALTSMTNRDMYEAFTNASVHSLEGAIWETLQKAGVTDSNVINYADPLLLEITGLKNELHEEILRKYGEEVPGAGAFVRALAEHGFKGKMAVASTSLRRDALMALEVVGVLDLFPDERIITKERFTHAKPHPDAFDTAFKSLGLPTGTPRQKVLAFEDDPRGIMSAKAAGLFTCAITTKYSKKALTALEVAPDLVADSYAEFMQLLQLSPKA
jgi:beta-phosphoglucomutase